MIMVDYDRSNPQIPPRYQTPTSSSHRSPHLSHLDHPSPLSTPSPTFSYAQPHSQGGGRQNITSYPSPGSYPSPSMSSYSTYPIGQPSVFHRDSPTFSSTALPAPSALALPPIRLAPPPTSSPVPQHIQIGSPLPVPAPTLHSMQNYYQQMPGGQGHLTSSPLHQPMRYPLPSVSQPERIMSGGRHKKEIKRRTKTGCLTCRKRRIKCDEGHPTCKNCAKSKRECLGYDPIFKTQAGPAAIQPAPMIGQAPMAPVYQMQGSPMMPQAPMMQMPQHMPTSMPMNYNPALSATGSSPRSVYDYDPYPAIDPNLESAILPPPHSPSASERMLHDTNGSFRPDLKRTYDRASPFSSTSDTSRTMGTPIPRSVTPGTSGYASYGAYTRDDMLLGSSAKRIKVNDLLSGAIPPPPTPPPSEHTYVSGPDGTRHLFQQKYAPAFDNLFETGWFGNECVTSLLINTPLVDTLSDLLTTLKTGEPLASDVDATFRAKGNQDGVILYNVMRLIYSTRNVNENIKRAEDGMDYNKVAKETLERVRIVEALVWGDYLEPTPGSSSPQYNIQEEQDDKREASFWALLKTFLTIKNDGSLNAKATLDTAAKFIDDRENRDILYTIAMTRHLNAMLSDKNGVPQSPGTFRMWNERLVQHQEFLRKLATSPVDAVNTVTRRVCARAVSSWGVPDGSTTPDQ